jgi:CheY-like chemotaxis protein
MSVDESDKESPMPKILVVEDNEENRDSLSRRLQRRGFVVVMAADGRIGVEMAKVEKPDLILMDMNMPEVDGWEATRQIKADSALSKVPVIALTAHAMSSDRARALDAGCTDYLTKPIEFTKLLSLIESILKGVGEMPKA